MFFIDNNDLTLNKSSTQNNSPNKEESNILHTDKSRRRSSRNVSPTPSRVSPRVSTKKNQENTDEKKSKSLDQSPNVAKQDSKNKLGSVEQHTESMLEPSDATKTGLSSSSRELSDTNKSDNSHDTAKDKSGNIIYYYYFKMICIGHAIWGKYHHLTIKKSRKCNISWDQVKVDMDLDYQRLIQTYYRLIHLYYKSDQY